MFVFNCNIDLEEQLKYPKHEANKKKFKKSKKYIKTAVEVADNEIESSAEYDLYRPVACTHCSSNIGVFDETDEIYYFFNVLASHT